MRALRIVYRDIDCYSFKRFRMDEVRIKYDDNILFVFEGETIERLKFAVPINRIVYCEVEE